MLIDEKLCVVAFLFGLKIFVFLALNEFDREAVATRTKCLFQKLLGINIQLHWTVFADGHALKVRIQRLSLTSNHTTDVFCR